MNRNNIFIATLLFPIPLMAQKTERADSINQQHLQEVVVEGSRIVRHKGYDTYIPSETLRNHSANGLDLLSNMALPHIRIDQVEKKIANTFGTGNVIIEINNVEATFEDLQSLLPSQIQNVEYSTTPRMKYGSGIGAVINVRTKRNEKGLAAGLNTMNAITTNYNDDGIWGKMFCGRSEFGLQYNFKLNDITKAYNNKEENFHYADGSLKQLKEAGTFAGGDYRNDNFVLSYNYTKPQKRVIDVKLSYSWDRFPERTLNTFVTGDETFDMKTFTQSDEKGTTLKTYYNECFSDRNSLEVNAALSYMDSKYDRGFSSPKVDSRYKVDGQKYSIRAHVNYTHNFNDISSIVLGYQQMGAYTDNVYTDNKQMVAGMNTNAQYLFAEYTTSVGPLAIIAGVGGSRHSFSQATNKYSFFSFRPTVTLQYDIDRQWQIVYKLWRDASVPDLAELTAYDKQEDTYQVVTGNPGLKPFNTDTHALIASWQNQNFSARLYGLYQYTHHGIANAPIVEHEKLFWYTMDNNLNHHHFETALYASGSFLRRMINIYVEPKYEYDLSKGIFNNHNGRYSVQTGLNAYYGKWSANIYFRTATEILSGNILTHNYATSDLNIGYRHNALMVRAGLRNAFNKVGKSSTVYQLSDIVKSTLTQGNRGFGNMVYLSLSWNFLKGKQGEAQQVPNIVADNDAGIVK